MAKDVDVHICVDVLNEILGESEDFGSSNEFSETNSKDTATTSAHESPLASPPDRAGTWLEMIIQFIPVLETHKRSSEGCVSPSVNCQ